MTTVWAPARPCAAVLPQLLPRRGQDHSSSRTHASSRRSNRHKNSGSLSRRSSSGRFSSSRYCSINGMSSTHRRVRQRPPLRPRPHPPPLLHRRRVSRRVQLQRGRARQHRQHRRLQTLPLPYLQRRGRGCLHHLLHPRCAAPTLHVRLCSQHRPALGRRRLQHLL